MASTFTTNKSIEKPANGDYVNTWSTPVNSDWDIIDASLGGTTTLNATGATGTTTLSASQYRPPTIIVTGVLTANVTYRIPSGVGGQWVAYNNTTGSFTLTFDSGGGGTSTNITQGARVLIYCDGTNVALGVTTTPSTAAGSSGQIQYNSGGSLAGSSNLTYDGSANVVLGATGVARLDVRDSLRLYGSTTGYFGLTVPASAGSTTYTLPNADGTSGQVLTTNGSGTLSWTTASGGVAGVTSFSAGTTGLTPAAASTGAVTLAGTLAVANGGTGQTTYTNGQLLIGNSTGNTLTKATLTAGSGVTITNGAGSITIAATGGTGDVVGPASATDNAIARFDGASGKLIKNSAVTIGNTGVLTTTADASINGVSVGKGTGSGASNTAVGSTAGDSMTNGYENVMVGATAGTGVTSGYQNTMVGFGAGDVASTGNSNVFVGRWAGIDITTGSFNTGVGVLTLGNAFINTSNSSAFGYNAQVSGSNQVQLGDGSTTTYVYGTVQNRSDLRDKTDVQDTDLGLGFIMALRPRKFRWDMREDYKTPRPGPGATAQQIEAWKQANRIGNLSHNGTYKRNRFHQGLVAQEVKQVMDSMGIDFGGYQDHKVKGGEDVLSIGYDEMIAPLIKAIQELKAEFDEYKRTHP